MSFEEAFAGVEQGAEGVLKAASALATQARGLLKAGRQGDIPGIRRFSESLGSRSEALLEQVGRAQSAWPFQPGQEEEVLRSSFTDELVAAAAREGLSVRRQDDRLLAYPAVLRLLPAKRKVEIDRRERNILRPSRLVAELKERAKHTNARPEQFIEVLHQAYERLSRTVAPSGVPLHQVYDLLTLAPQWRRQYSSADFGRDIYFLDRSETSCTKGGARVSFPASTGTKGASRTYSFVSPDGELVVYYGVRFQL